MAVSTTDGARVVRTVTAVGALAAEIATRAVGNAADTTVEEEVMTEVAAEATIVVVEEEEVIEAGAAGGGADCTSRKSLMRLYVEI